MKNMTLSTIFGRFTIAVNFIFVAWILFNGLDSGWKGKPAEIASYAALALLLLINSYFIFSARRK